MSRQKHFKRRRDDCLTECVARLLNVHPETVPLFIAKGKEWPRYFKSWCRRRGLGMQYGHWTTETHGASELVIAVGRVAPRSWHAVLYRGGVPFYDPAYRRRPFITKEPEYMWRPYRVGKRLPKSVPSRYNP